MYHDEEGSFITNPLNKTKTVLSSTESSTGTYFEDSGVKYTVNFDDEDFNRTISIISSTESSTGTLFDTTSSSFLDPLAETNSSMGTYFEESSPTKCSSTFDSSQDNTSSIPEDTVSLSENNSLVDTFNVFSSTKSSTRTSFDTTRSSFLDPLAETNSSTGTYFEESSPTKCSSTFDSYQDKTSSIPEEEVSLSENNSLADILNSFVLLNMSDISLKNVTGDRLQIAVPMKMFHNKLLQSLTRK